MSKPEPFLILPDLHVPFHNAPLIKRVCQLALDIKPSGLILSGDFGDFFSIAGQNSNSLARLRSLTLKDEYDAQNKVLNDIGVAVGRAAKHFLFGNHEDRFVRWLGDGDNAKMDGAVECPAKALSLERRGYKVYPNWKDDSVPVGPHLEVIHGEYCVQHSAFKHLQEYEGSVVMGHTHRWNAHVTGRRGAYNIGWLGDKDNPAFSYATKSQRRRWCNGFMVAYLMADGTFIPSPVQVWNSHFVYSGKLY